MKRKHVHKQHYNTLHWRQTFHCTHVENIIHFVLFLLRFSSFLAVDVFICIGSVRSMYSRKPVAYYKVIDYICFYQSFGFYHINSHIHRHIQSQPINSKYRKTIQFREKQNNKKQQQQVEKKSIFFHILLDIILSIFVNKLLLAIISVDSIGKFFMNKINKWYWCAQSAYITQIYLSNTHLKTIPTHKQEIKNNQNQRRRKKICCFLTRHYIYSYKSVSNIVTDI